MEKDKLFTLTSPNTLGIGVLDNFTGKESLLGLMKLFMKEVMSLGKSKVRENFNIQTRNYILEIGMMANNKEKVFYIRVKAIF